MSGIALFALLNGLALVVAAAAARFLLGGGARWREQLGAIAFVPVLIQLCVLGAHATTGLEARGLLLWLAGTGALVSGARLRQRRARASERERVRAASAASTDPLDWLAFGLAGALLTAWCVKSGMLGTSFVWDDLSYHAALPAWWLQQGSIDYAPFTFQSYYPLNSELVSLWLLAPLRADAYASLAVLLFGALAAASLARVAAGLGAGAGAAALALALFFASQVVWNPSNGFAGNDLAGAAALLASLALLVPDADGRPNGRDFAAAGLLAGYAAGCKVPFVAGAALVFAGAVGIAREQRAARLAQFALGAALTGSYWYARNWIATGNPLYPAEFLWFAGPFDAAAQSGTRGFSLRFWRDVLPDRLNWPPPLALASALGFAYALVHGRGAASPGTHDAATEARAALRRALLVTGLGCLALYPLLPFSATPNRPDAALHSGYLRFLIAPFGIGLALLAPLLGGRSPRARAAQVAAAIAIAASWRLSAMLSTLAFAGGVAALWLRANAPGAVAGILARPAARRALGAAALAALALLAPEKQRRSDENLFHYQQRRAPIGRAFREVDRLPAGSRLALFMSEPQDYAQFYPLFGRRLQHTPVAVERDGRARRPLHERASADGARGDWWSGWHARDAALDPASFASALAAQRVDYALVTSWSLGEWPPQEAALAAAPNAARIWSDGTSSLWRIVRESAPAAQPRADRPSLLWITVDTLRADHLSRSGHTRATTPYLDSFFREGVYCSRCYAQSSWTLPSMLSLFSSLSPAEIGITSGVKPIPRAGESGEKAAARRDIRLEHFSEQHTTIAEVLRAEGYATAGISTNGHLRVEQGFAQGFDRFDQTSCMWGSAACALGRARAWIEERGSAAEAPLFLWIHLFDPHFDNRRDGSSEHPLYAPPAGYASLFPAQPGEPANERVRRAYDRKLRYLDDQLRGFFEELRARGWLERSVVALSADHGEEFDEHGRWGHSKALTDTLVHVPLFFRFPSGAPAGDYRHPVRNLDVAPTLLDALGVAVPPSMRGQSLLPAFRGETPPALPAYGETRRFELDLRYWLDPASERKLVLDLAKGKRALFDPARDPGERDELSAREPETAAALERQLRARIAEDETRAISAQPGGTVSEAERRHLKDLGYLE
jgi:arylsulfatase A-like enzyme